MIKMPNYFYIAKSLEGEEKFGEMEAPDEHQLARILRQEGYVLISANLEKKIKEDKFSISIPFLNRVSLKEKIFFVRNLRVMVSAGISLPRSIRTLSDVSKNKKFKKALYEIVEEVGKGKSFADALTKYPDIFSEFFCSLIKAGEESGTLEEALKNLTQQMERENELKSKLMGAMIYPAVVISAMIGIGILMLVMVVPKLAETFKDLGIDLPLTTRVVIAIGNFMAERWYFGLLIIVAFIFLLRAFLRTKTGKKIIDGLSLKIPIIAPLLQKTNSAYTARTIGSLVTSGVSIVRALEITAGILGNVNFKQAMIDSAEKVRKGEKLSEALRAYENLYPPVVIQMIEVGEETGETSDILQKLADFFEEEVTSATKNISSVIEPVLMLLIGGAIGFFAVSMIQPMYSMLSAIK